MGQERQEPGHQSDSDASAAEADPTHSGTRVRRSELPAQGAPRPSARPTPFGLPVRNQAPRPDGNQPPTRTLSGWPPVPSPLAGMAPPPPRGALPPPTLGLPPPPQLAAPPSPAPSLPYTPSPVSTAALDEEPTRRSERPASRAAAEAARKAREQPAAGAAPSPAPGRLESTRPLAPTPSAPAPADRPSAGAAVSAPNGPTKGAPAPADRANSGASVSPPSGPPRSSAEATMPPAARSERARDLPAAPRSERPGRPSLPPAPMPAEAPAFRGQVEELLPLGDVTQSMPRIPLAAVFPPLTEPEPAEQGRSWLQVGAFALVIAASVVPVLRYVGVVGGPRAAEARAPAPQKAAPGAATIEVPAAAPPVPAVTAPAPVSRAPATSAPVATPDAPAADPVAEAVARIETTLPAAPDQAADTLVAAAEHALSTGEQRLAETLLGHALKLDDKNPHAAYTLAKLRLDQNNLEGAEGWILNALKLRPRRAEYHALYADILASQGHAQHARRERKRAASLRR